MKKRKTKGGFKTALCLVLALAMCAGLMPSGMTAFAADDTESDGAAYSVTLNQTTGGTLSFGDTDGNCAEFSAGEEVTVYAQPEDGIVLGRVYVSPADGETYTDDSATGADSYSFTMPNGDVVITATFIWADEVGLGLQYNDWDPMDDYDSCGVSTLAVVMDLYGKELYFDTGEYVSYGEEYNTHRMTVSTDSSAKAGSASTKNNAYCVEPFKLAPLDEVVTGKYYDLTYFHMSESDAELLRKVMWYSYDAPGWDELSTEARYSLWHASSDDNALTSAHTLLAYIYGGESTALDDSGAKLKLGDDYKNWARTYLWGDSSDSTLNQIKALDAPPDSFHVYAYTEEGYQIVVFWMYETGFLAIQKESENPSITDGNSCYSFDGAVYHVYTDSDCTENGLVTDKNGNPVELITDASGKSNSVELDVGTYYVKEIVAPKGYELDTTTPCGHATVTAGTTEDDPVVITVTECPANDPANIAIYKEDAETGEMWAQGAASLEGAQFTVCYYDYDGDDYESYVQSHDPTRTWVIQTKYDATDDSCYAFFGDGWKVSGDDFYYQDGVVVLPLGTYTIQETKAPEGYLIEGDFTYAVGDDAEEAGKAGEVFVTQLLYGGDLLWEVGGNYYTQEENVIRGGVEIQKRDVQSLRDEPQGNASFEGITLEITNDSEHFVMVDSDGDGTLERFEPGEVVMTLTTDADGYAATAADALPYGSYTVTETAVPSYDSRVEGDGYLLGNYNGNTLAAHEEAIAQSNTSISFEIRENGKIVNLTGDTTENGESEVDKKDAITDLVKRGDFALVKKDGETQNSMGSIPFEITSLTTGESHVIWTDENGDYSSDSTWNRHTYNTNRGEDWTDGLWFYGYADGEASGEVVDDSLGALPVDAYRIDELPCEANEGYEMYHGTFTIYEDVRLETLDTIYNYPEPEVQPLSIHTMAWAGDTGTQFCNAEDAWVTLYDNVYYTGLNPGETYYIYGVALDSETREPELDANGNKISAVTSFVADETGSGMEVQAFYFDVENLSNRRVVFFETIYQLDEDGNAVLVIAEDPEDYEAQTIYFPAVGTTLTEEESGAHCTIAGDEVTVVDMVTVTEIPEGTECVIRGTLMDKATGEPLTDADGNAITASVSFVSAGLDEQVFELSFTFDASLLTGNGVVAFEELYLVSYPDDNKDNDPDEILIGQHEDLDDADQTVTFPEIFTTATNAEDGEKTVAAGEITINDEVFYYGLTPGESYRMRATIMDKETGEPLVVNGETITAEVEFVAEEADGSVIVPITFDATGLDGKHLVAFEKAYILIADVEGGLGEGTDTEDIIVTEYEVANHEDLTDEDQTVFVGQGKTGKITTSTTANGPKTGDMIWPIVLAIVIAAAVVALIVVLLVWRKKRVTENE